MMNLEEGEKVIMEARRHWFTIGTTGASLFFLAIAPAVIVVVLGLVFPEIALALNGSKFYAAAGLFGATWLLVIWIIFFMSWTDYYLDVLILTNKRLIDIEQKGFFRRHATTIPLGSIEDITIEIKGPLRTFLKFGDLEVQTAASSKEVEIKDLENPVKIKTTILSALHELNNKNA